MSIRPGWFWHENEEPHSLTKLYKTWLTSYGANACMHLNIPPNNKGLIDERDVKRLAELGELLQKEFGAPILTCKKPQKEEDSFDYQPIYRIPLPAPLPQQALRHIVLREEIALGQRVESFKVKARYQNGRCYSIYEGTCIGNRKIIPLNASGELFVHITASRDIPELLPIELY